MDRTFATLLGTGVIVALGVLFSNSRLSSLDSQLSDKNRSLDIMQQNLGLALQNMTGLFQGRKR